MVQIYFPTYDCSGRDDSGGGGNSPFGLVVCCSSGR